MKVNQGKITRWPGSPRDWGVVIGNWGVAIREGCLLLWKDTWLGRGWDTVSSQGWLPESQDKMLSGRIWHSSRRSEPWFLQPHNPHFTLGVNITTTEVIEAS